MNHTISRRLLVSKQRIFRTTTPNKLYQLALSPMTTTCLVTPLSLPYPSSSVVRCNVRRTIATTTTTTTTTTLNHQQKRNTSTNNGTKNKNELVEKKNNNNKTKKIKSLDKAMDLFINGPLTIDTTPPTTISPPTTNKSSPRRKKRKSQSSRPSSITINNNNNNNNNKRQFQVFCSCLPGLEPYLYNELLTLGIQPSSSAPPTTPTTTTTNEGTGNDDTTPNSSSTRLTRRSSGGDGPPLRGGVAFTTQSLTQLLSCHLYLGTASHVLLRATPKPFQALGMEELVRKVSLMPFWAEYIHIPKEDVDGRLLPKLDIRVTSSKSRLFHTVGIAERVERGIWDALGVVEFDEESPNTNTNTTRKSSSTPNRTNDTLPNPTTTDSREEKEGMKVNVNEEDEDENVIKILVRLHRNQVEISIDTSTTPLHKRGYRLEGGKAPLREDLAYSLLYSAGWGGQHSNSNSPRSLRSSIASSEEKEEEDNPNSSSTIRSSAGLIDPFCGSGTIVIEGAGMLYGLPPGRLRPAPMACSRHRMEYPQAWDTMVTTALERANDRIQKMMKEEEEEASSNNEEGTTTTVVVGRRAVVMGSDRDGGVIDAALKNAERAGVLNLIYLERCAIGSNRWLNEPTLLAPRDFLLVATNPPYGHRISSSKMALEGGGSGAPKRRHREKRHHLLPLYQTLGHKVEKMVAFNDSSEGGSGVSSSSGENKRSTQLATIAQDPKLVRQSGVKDLNVQFSTKHGGLDVCALTTTTF